ncbi:MAG: hypothetical protein ACD_20C00191G0001 [uncultured bacterium]|nr:MAG: hypothetical protein ACD_20C00191G0001 [uncultured bacterium]
MKLIRLVLLLLIAVLINSGVGIIANPAFAQQSLTVGTVQKYIHKGMSQDQVVMALGSPNIVTQDGNGKETWVYDKMSSTIVDRNKNESALEKGTAIKNSWRGLLNLVTLGLLTDGKTELRDVSQLETSQNTLTIVIKFDEKNSVESYSYHSSKF